MRDQAFASINRDKGESYFVIPLLCLLGLAICWRAAYSDIGESSGDISELETEFSKVLPPLNAEKQGAVRHVENFNVQVVSADYSTNMATKDLERYYDGALKKNGWIARATAYGSDQRFNLYCKGRFDAVLDKASAPGHYFFGVRRQQGSSATTNCMQ